MRVTAWLLLVCGLMPGGLCAQSGGAASLDFGMGIGAPGEHASVPVTLLTASPARVGKISFEVSFSTELLSFNSVREGEAAELPRLEIETQLQQKEDEAILRVELSSSSPIPTGELIHLQFDVSPEALPNQEFALKSLVEEGQTLEGEGLTLSATDGLIIVAVLGEAIPACFFYMH